MTEREFEQLRPGERVRLRFAVGGEVIRGTVLLRNTPTGNIKVKWDVGKPGSGEFLSGPRHAEVLESVVPKVR